MPINKKTTQIQPKDFGQWSKLLEEKSKAPPSLIFPNDCVKYQDNPIAFATEVLGIKTLYSKQLDILNAIVNHRSVAVKSGHKVAKTFTACIIALWWYCCFPEARVIMTSVTANQIRNVLWRQLGMLYQKSLVPLDGTFSVQPFNGLKSFDYREIIGFTAKEPEAMAGISGKLLYILDEASGIPDNIFEAIEGNRAGGARLIMFSNPTRLTGTFFEAFHKNSSTWFTISISSEDSPNYIEGREVIPNLAGREWIEEKKQEWGEESPLYQIRVKGNFPNQDEFTIIPTHLVTEATSRYRSLSAEDCEINLKLPEYNGPFNIGVDPARFGGDESSICFRQNKRVHPLVTVNGLDSKELLEFFYTHYYKLTRNLPMAPGILPTVYVDDTGGYGSGFIDHIDRRKFNVVPVNFSEKPASDDFINARAEMWFAILDWLKSGNVILADDDKEKLSHELTMVQFKLSHNGKRQIQSKDEIKKIIKRSPDRADSLALSLFDYNIEHQSLDNKPAKIVRSNNKPQTIYNVISPYGGIINRNKPQSYKQRYL